MLIQLTEKSGRTPVDQVTTNKESSPRKLSYKKMLEVSLYFGRGGTFHAQIQVAVVLKYSDFLSETNLKQFTHNGLLNNGMFSN